MSAAQIDISDLKAHGEGFCAGGHHPDPALDAYPLLCWSAAHPRFGEMVVHLSDQKASVHDVATAIAEYQSIDALASRFGTDEAHVSQAIDYAIACGCLAR
jgi:hypothetical protein